MARDDSKASGGERAGRLIASCWRCVFGNKDLRVEIMAAFLLVLTGGITGIGAFMLAMRSANLEQRRHEYELVRDRREAMKEFAREIPRQQVMLRQIAKRTLWTQSVKYWPPSEARATFWEGDMLPDEVEKDRRRLLEEWTASEGYTSVCWHARAYFGSTTGRIAPDKIEDSIQRLDDLLGMIGNLGWTGDDTFDEQCRGVVAEVERALESGVADAREEARLLEARTKAERAMVWRVWFSTLHAGGVQPEGSPEETLEQRRQYAIVNLVDAYNDLASALYERTLALMSAKIRMGEQD